MIKLTLPRIAQYGEEKHKSLKPSKLLNADIISLKELLGFRKRLVRENAGYKASIKEREPMYGLSKKDMMIKALHQKLKANNKIIEATEAAIMKIIAADEQMQLNYSLITSIKGIGKVNALMTIAFTENFTSFTNPRSYAVYVGVVPFDSSSGTSIRGRKRVSHIANKELKQELNQAARSAMVWDKEINAYTVNKLLEYNNTFVGRSCYLSERKSEIVRICISPNGCKTSKSLSPVRI